MQQTNYSESLSLSQEKIDLFLEQLREKGRGASTLDSYRRTLERLSRQLPGSTSLDRTFLSSWREKLAQEDCSVHTRNVRVAAVNSFVIYFDRPDLRLLPFQNRQTAEPEELSRGEYMRLLQTAKNHGNERLYLLIKTLCITGIPLQDLPSITVEMLRGKNTDTNTKAPAPCIPDFLREELLDYSSRHDIVSGAVFVTRNGKPLERNNIYAKIRELCYDARVSEKKANPLCLRKLHQSTQTAILDGLRHLAQQQYYYLLEKEEQTIGWDV